MGERLVRNQKVVGSSPIGSTSCRQVDGFFSDLMSFICLDFLYHSIDSGDFMRLIETLAAEFSSCRKILQALGDEARQLLILEITKAGNCHGVRVCEITAKTHLPRSSVSHHLRILKEAGLIRIRREGTRNYYYFDADAKTMHELMTMLEHAKQIIQEGQKRRSDI